MTSIYKIFTQKELDDWLSDYDNLSETVIPNIEVSDYVFHHKGLNLNQVLDVGREVVRQRAMDGNKALDAAVSALYLNDRNYKAALYEVVKSLTGLVEPKEEEIKNLYKMLNKE